MSSELEKTYDQIAEYWHEDHQTDDWWIEGTDKFISFLPEKSSVLDVGCGSGVKSKYFVDRGFSVTGVDISEGLLRIAKDFAPEAEFLKMSMLELGRLEKRFDGVFAQASLLHVSKKDVPRAIENMKEHTLPGGFVYLAVKESRPGEPDERMEKENDYGFEYERFFSYFSLPELEDYLKNAGLGVVHTMRSPSPSGKTVWLQIIAKK